MVTILMVRDKNPKLPESAALFYVVKMLEGIPKDLTDLFVPDGEDALMQLEMNVVRWLARVQERRKVIKLQKRYKLPLRPNQSLRDVTIRLKILEMRKRKQEFNNGDDENNDERNFY